MCCLFGLMDYGHQFSGRQKARLFRSLALQSQARGTDATGCAYNSGGRLHIDKRPLPARRFHPYIPGDAAVLMGHTRMATQGSAGKNRNNHPFEGHIGSSSFALAHNGVLYNDRILRRELKLPATAIETDSYAAVQLLERQKALTPDSLKTMAEQVEGTFVFTVLDEENTLFFVRGHNPLCLYHLSEEQLYLYASTEEILKRALNRSELRQARFQEVAIRPGDILQINARGERSTSRFQLNDFSPWSYPVWAAPLPSLQGQADSYVDELKSVAGAFGYSSTQIDRLLDHGFTPEEIEELFYCGEV